MKKENQEPINISPTLKDFFVYVKGKLKRNTRTFYSMDKTLLYYLSDSSKFVNDYSEYCEQFNIENNVEIKETEKMDTNKIMEYEGDISLDILNND